MTLPPALNTSVASAYLRPSAPSQRPGILRCENVTFRYPDGTVGSQGIDLELRAGEITCLLGPNGAGKTTLLRQVVGELRPSQGRVVVDGRDAREAPARAKRLMGIVPQGAGLFSNVTVIAHLRCFAEMKRIARDRARATIEEVLQECDLQKQREQKAGHLSGGQQRKLLLALALLGAPPVLVLDEPSVGLDPLARRALWETIERQRARGTAILLTTHYMDEAERLANVVSFIERGQIVRTGSQDDLFAAVPFSIRLSVLDPETGSTTGSEYFNTVAEAQRFAVERRLEAYSLGRVSLEDVFVRLVGPGASVRAPQDGS